MPFVYRTAGQSSQLIWTAVRKDKKRNSGTRIFPGSYGSAVVGEPFNGDVLANVMTGASYLNRLRRHPENYTAPVYRRGRRGGLRKLDQYLRSFFDCLARNSVP